MADNIKDLTLETATDEVKTDEVKTDEFEGTAKTGLLGATANSNEDIPATSFTTKTAPDGTDNLILFNQNTNVGYQIDYDNLADAILNKITSKTFSNQVGGSSAATLLAQLATLNSKFAGKEYTIPRSGTLTLDSTMLPHSYIVTTYASTIAALSIRIGTGYGMSDNFTTSRHKQVTLIDSTDVTMQPLSTAYGLVINNGSSTSLTVWVINLTPQTY